MPKNQVKLLQLWDKINLPHKESKQIHGSSLTIISIEVNMNALFMMMPPDALRELISAIDEFVSSNLKFTLQEWQRLAGWINQSFNVFPLLRPCLNNFYAKISGKCALNKYIRINNAVCADLTGAARHLDSDDGVCLFHHIHWDISSADIIIYCEACLDGMGFWLPDKCVGYYSPVPDSTTENRSFISKLYVSYQPFTMPQMSYRSLLPPKSSYTLITTTLLPFSTLSDACPTITLSSSTLPMSPLNLEST